MGAFREMVSREMVSKIDKKRYWSQGQIERMNNPSEVKDSDKNPTGVLTPPPNPH